MCSIISTFISELSVLFLPQSLTASCKLFSIFRKMSSDTAEKEAWTGMPSTRTCAGFIILPLEQLIPGGLDPAGESGLSQKKADSRRFRRAQWRAPCQAILNPPQSSSGTQACLGSRDEVAAPIWEVEGNKAGTDFLSFSLMSCLCYVAV